MEDVTKFDNEKLLSEFAINCMGAGDDFSIHPYTEQDENDGEALRAEILRRMKGGE